MAVPGEAVLITGVYGTGKTTVCEELAERLESAGVASGAIDLDWLGWIESPQLDAAAADRTYLANLSAVTTNYAEAGVQCLVLAGTVRSNAELDALRTVVPFPVGIVRLILPLEEIERRLSGTVTLGRARDVPNAARWLEHGIGAALCDLTATNDRPARNYRLSRLREGIDDAPGVHGR